MTDTVQTVLDLRLSLKEHARGDLIIIQTWFLDETKQPCLVILPRQAYRAQGRVIPCIVLQSSAWRWDEVTGDPVYAFDNARAFARTLGFNDNDPMTIFHITQAVQGLLGDLVLQMPYERYAALEGVADVTITDTDGKTRHQEVKDYVH